jgi:hypothetical protein
MLLGTGRIFLRPVQSYCRGRGPAEYEIRREARGPNSSGSYSMFCTCSREVNLKY